jgi:hypothetical protein
MTGNAAGKSCNRLPNGYELCFPIDTVYTISPVLTQAIYP